MLEELKKIRKGFIDAIKKGGASELADMELRYLGRKGMLRDLVKKLSQLPQNKRRKFGKDMNELKTFIQAELLKRKVKGQRSKVKGPEIDLTLPGKKAHRGHLHPLTLIQDEMAAIFKSLNFSVVEGPEAETEWYNFDALNIPPNHPARDMWQTFWLKTTNDQRPTTNDSRKSLVVSRRLLLRTHTSPVQIRFMETHNPPLRIIAPGRVFRYEASDATHDIQFYQLEGLMVDKEASVASFKYIIEAFFKKLFGKEFGGIRLRPSYFPFTEPSFEVDFYWKRKGSWLEIMGAGMVHPNVFRAAGYAPLEWQGFAFGIGIDRVAMMKYKIPDIRLFYSGDLRVIRQF
ncbi:MAG: phenylalanine--tRNA ligase subunit alpha [Candidatus Portnoybacteria bacterium]|nr:phenylalanine--tRNA ligase subunit alpha [Candidatus Portnoybacteria bacterium]